MNREAQKTGWESKSLIPKMEVSSTNPGVQLPPTVVSLSLHISNTVANSHARPIVIKIMAMPWKITSLDGYTQDQHEACSRTGIQRAIDGKDKDQDGGKMGLCQEQVHRPSSASSRQESEWATTSRARSQIRRPEQRSDEETTEAPQSPGCHRVRYSTCAD